jgi:hypothetical protein
MKKILAIMTMVVALTAYHGVSMFVPQDPTAGNYAKYNQDIKKMSWYEAVGLDSLCH